jgi:hypothetical protein
MQWMQAWEALGVVFVWCKGFESVAIMTMGYERRMEGKYLYLHVTLYVFGSRRVTRALLIAD